MATASSELDQTTVLSAASSGLTVATSVSEAPSFSASSVLFNSTEVTAIGSAGLAACVTVNDLVAEPLLIVTVAVRSLSVLFGCAVTVILTVPAPPELGSTVSHVEDLVSVIDVVHDSVALNVTVCVWG